MSYLILNDYYAQIQIQNLAQIIGGDNSKLTVAAQKAQEQCLSYLVQKYDTASEFSDTNVWSFTKAYNAHDRVYLDAPAYNQAATYLLNTLTLQGGNVYICSTAIPIAEVFNITHWTLLGPQYTIFYVAYPQPVFKIASLYNVSDKVFWENKVYTCAIQSQVPDHDTSIQYATIQNQPFVNVFPDNTLNGSIYWGAGVAFSVVAGTLPTNTTFWTQGDNRSQQLVEILIDLTLYKIHGRISPRNIPEIRVKNHDDAIQWLKDVRKGDVTANLPIIQPSQGMRIRYGGNIKICNSY